MEIVTEVAFQCRFKPTNDCVGSGPLVWDAQADDWAFRTGASNHDWSGPIFACGDKTLGRDGAVIIDACEPIVTDGLTKAASSSMGARPCSKVW